jgi:ribonucleotide monophosphatase NagD (HAD superfamily)
MVVAFDIDGTLAQGPFLPNNVRQMAPRPEIVGLLRRLRRAGIQIMVVTARPEAYRPDTEWWLRRHAIPYHTLRMRSSGDSRPDPALRAEQASGATVLFDDKPENCAQVAVRCVKV